MAKFMKDLIMDEALNYIKNNADQLVLCDGEPADYTDATTDKGSGGHALGETSIGSADFTLADGDTDGRKVTLAAQNDVSVDVSGTADHYAVVDDTNSDLLYVTTISNSQSVTSGNTFSSNAIDEEIGDPV
jgi:hypothetical protein